ncbi:MAG: type II toxin-antitoxin system RelE/ParE family toxin [Anaerolineae bacterium]|nr:type II toxin-antitoxin system RelE/ParE family toxin [Anaerolineae bacterium]
MSRYTLYILPQTFNAIKTLPGNIRQRVKRAIDQLADDPRPTQSKILTVADAEYELRRLRLGRWRIIYAITEAEKFVDVLAVRKRPPYDYGDLEALLQEI